MKLNELFNAIPNCSFTGNTGLEITGISSDSKKIKPGYLFIAKKGRNFDGTKFIGEAVHAGAVAVLTTLNEGTVDKCTHIYHSNPSSLESLLSATYYGNPSDKLLVVGITGTNGKTTTSYVIKNLLDYFFSPCGLIGTIENIVGKHHYPTTHTTPDVVSNHRLLHEMVKEKGRSVVMEVTSHALDQGRVDEIDFDVAVFSNLTQDHLDYHETMENYCSAKNRLFTNLNQPGKVKKNLKWAVVNQDDPWKSSILKGCTAQVLSYGIHNKADLHATRISLEANGTRALLSYQGSSVEFFWPLIGRFNVYNCLAAISVLLTQSISLETIAAKMIGLPLVKGRLQSVSNQLGLKIYVDYAHTDDALINVLKTLKEIQTKGRIMVVFGCGGDRDRSKRPKMARAVENFADYCIVTSDNPRSESPSQICSEVIEGFSEAACYEVELDRFVAIKKIISLATLDDIILIAGKGHENYQIFSDRTIEFDDCKVAAMICDRL